MNRFFHILFFRIRYIAGKQFFGYIFINGFPFCKRSSHLLRGFCLKDSFHFRRINGQVDHLQEKDPAEDLPEPICNCFRHLCSGKIIVSFAPAKQDYVNDFRYAIANAKPTALSIGKTIVSLIRNGRAEHSAFPYFLPYEKSSFFPLVRSRSLFKRPGFTKMLRMRNDLCKRPASRHTIPLHYRH